MHAAQALTPAELELLQRMPLEPAWAAALPPKLAGALPTDVQRAPAVAHAVASPGAAATLTELAVRAALRLEALGGVARQAAAHDEAQQCASVLERAAWVAAHSGDDGGLPPAVQALYTLLVAAAEAAQQSAKATPRAAAAEAAAPLLTLLSPTR